jgi:hypothetical protein
MCHRWSSVVAALLFIPFVTISHSDAFAQTTTPNPLSNNVVSDTSTSSSNNEMFSCNFSITGMGNVIKCVATMDRVELSKIIINRGNCPTPSWAAAKVIDQKIIWNKPWQDRYKFGDGFSIVVPVFDCLNLLELELQANGRTQILQIEAQ